MLVHGAGAWCMMVQRMGATSELTCFSASSLAAAASSALTSARFWALHAEATSPTNAASCAARAEVRDGLGMG